MVLRAQYSCGAAARSVAACPGGVAQRAGPTLYLKYCLAHMRCGQRSRPEHAVMRRRSCKRWARPRCPALAAVPWTSPPPTHQTWQDLPGGSQEQRKKLANAEEVARLAAAKGVPVSPLSKADFGNLLGHRLHQGVALRTSPLEAGRVHGDKLPSGARGGAPSACRPSALTGPPPATPRGCGP